MEIKSETRENVELIMLDGKLDVNSASKVLELLESLIEEERVNIVVNMEKVTIISSYGLGALAMSLKNANSKGGSLKLVSLHPEVRVQFKITGLLEKFSVFEDMEEAVKSFS